MDIVLANSTPLKALTLVPHRTNVLIDILDAKWLPPWMEARSIRLAGRKADVPTEREEPRRTKCRNDRLDPNITLSITEKLLPNFAKDLTLREDPEQKQPTADSFCKLPMARRPWTLKALPSLVKDLQERAEPQ
jgi:hypothetical protein